MKTFDGRLASEVAVDPSANIGRVFRLGHAGEGTKEDPVPERGGHISVTLIRRSGRVLNAYQGKALASAMVSKERERGSREIYNGDSTGIYHLHFPLPGPTTRSPRERASMRSRPKAEVMTKN